MTRKRICRLGWRGFWQSFREHLGLWAQCTERDPAGRVLIQTSQGKDRKAVTRQYRYDAFGRRTHASCADRKLHWAYNTLGQITEHHQDRHRTTYGYGPGGRIETIQLPDGAIVHYHYDPQGRWHTLSVNGDTLIERTFDSQNRETTRTAGSNTQSQLHDRYGCLIKRKWQGQQSATRRYRWDAENRLEATEDSLAGSTHYQRDSQGQLTQENDTEYHYDLGGNRLPEGGQLQQDRLLTTATDKRGYDALGAEIRITGQTTEHRTFDAEGQLIELKRPSLHITYGYDALGRRAWRKTEAGTTSYLWHNDVLLGEQNPESQWQWYLRDPQTDEPLLALIDNQPHYYELDHRMMPVRLWDQSGQKVWEGHGDAWGKCQPETLEGNIQQSLRLPGQFEDELTGIVQNRFRDYDPGTGRYLTPDPYGLKGGLNSYRYTPNPVDYVDPLGLDFESVVTTKNASKGPEAAIGDTPAPAMSEVPDGESIGLKKNADGDLILCVGEEACADPSNVQDAGWGDIAAWGAMLALDRVPVGRVLDKVPLPKGVQNKIEEVSDKVSESMTELLPGKKGSWNKALNGDLKPNHKYKVGDKLYETDELGRVNRITGELSLNARDRNTYQQTKSGKDAGIKEGLADDDGRHLIASIFDGAGEQINYAPMNANLNRGAWKKMENKWAEALKSKPPKEVKVEVLPIYEGVGKRPVAFDVFYEIDGVEKFKSFTNTVGG